VIQLGKITRSGKRKTKIYLEAVHAETRVISWWLITRRYKENVKTH